MVRAKLKIEFFKMKTEKRQAGIDLHKLKDAENQKKYKEVVQNKILNIDEKKNEKWSNTVKICLEAAEEVVGRIKRGKQCQDLELEKWSKIQKKLRADIEASKSKNDRENMRKQRNEILNKIHQRKTKLERDKIKEKIEEIGIHKEDSNRMYQVVRQLQSKDNNKIIVNTEDGVTANESKQILA